MSHDICGWEFGEGVGQERSIILKSIEKVIGGGQGAAGLLGRVKMSY